ncbi:MAG: hypothetical protein CMK07_08225 [Ponticaulis sp.]|nr:hypothetical protein [Ponticaulis sp.]
MKRFVIALLISIGLTPFANAFDYVAGYKDWAVYRDTVNGEAVCYATTRANDKSPKSANHGDVVFFVTYFRNSSLPQASLRVSFNLREDRPASAIISRNSWNMYAVRNEIFANNEDESAIANALRRGSDLKIEAISERNTSVAYHFSLSGSSNAIDKAKELCG